MSEDFGKLFKVFLQARDKNVGEEAKLQKIVQELELKKYSSKMLLSNAIFEQKLEAYKLQRQVKEIAKKAQGSQGQNKDVLIDISMLDIPTAVITSNAALLITGVRHGNPPVPMENWSESNDRIIAESQASKKSTNHFGYVSDSGSGVSLPNIGARSLWPGDPQAIASVRRSRKSMAEELKKEENLSGIRKAKRDFSHHGKGTCSKNCTNPGVTLDSIASSSAVVSLPLLRKDIRILARNEIRRQKEIAALPTIVESVPIIAHNPRNVVYLRPNKFDRLAITSLPWLNVPQPLRQMDAKERARFAKPGKPIQFARIDGGMQISGGVPRLGNSDHDAHAIERVAKINCAKTPFVK